MSQILLAAGGASVPTYVDDVFSAYTYTGNNTSQTITNGIDLAGKGGLVWLKNRGRATTDHTLFDTVRGANNALYTSSTTAQLNSLLTAQSFSSSGFALTSNIANVNLSSDTYVSWTFRKAAKFFDVVTYTGNGTSSNVINHALGVKPGLVIMKRTDSTGDWWVSARQSDTAYTYGTKLNLTDAATGTWNPGGVLSASTANVALLGSNPATDTNISGASYVAYLFAHDTATDGLIQCGSFTTNGSGNATVSLGWEPQFITFKTSSGAGGWYMGDSARGWTTDGAFQYLFANTSGAEAAGTGLKLTATGFSGTGLGATVTYIYLAIRRPNKPPTTGTQVYNAIARTGTGAAANVTGVGFAPDLLWYKARNQSGQFSHSYNRLVGTPRFQVISTTAVEIHGDITKDVKSLDMDGFTVGPSLNTPINSSGSTDIFWLFKRAPQVFDEVCYTGTGSATTVTHGLGVTPELMIVKSRGPTVANWPTYHSTLGATNGLYLNLTNASASLGGAFNTTSPTASVFSIGTPDSTNKSGDTFVAYLFATKAGISKVGSYTGNGSSQTINCGFTTGARFVLIKRTNSTGDWYVWDTVRGVIAGNDPHVSLTGSNIEDTVNDTIDPDNSGFIVNQLAATNVNVTSATYIYLAFA